MDLLADGPNTNTKKCLWSDQRRAIMHILLFNNLFVTCFNPREPLPPSSNPNCQEPEGNKEYFFHLTCINSQYKYTLIQGDL